MNKLLLVNLFALSTTPSFAQSSDAQRVVTGYWSITGCSPTTATPCFVQYGATGAIGYVGGYDIIVSNTPTVQNASYSASNAIGGWQNVSVFRNTTQPSGILDYVSVASKGGSDNGPDDLWFHQVKREPFRHMHG
jgi:hypothetical protein